MTTRVVALSSGLSESSSSTLLAGRITAALGQRLGAEVSIETVELRPLAHEIIDASITGFAAPRLAHVHDQLREADAVVVVTPIYKASYPGLFKAFFDALDQDLLIGKPVLLAATGGTARHSLALDFALRPLFAYLQTVPVPTGVFASPHDWGSEGTGALTSRVERAVDELVSLLAGAGTGRSFSDDIDLFSETMLSISDPHRPE
ncbi:NADPH-dependent FMN reductase [Aeromicrobium sp. Root495]|uniref:CE1759 family FMN reductase n=1 Tax=Aeromicrobium sp. Root495 TaxID=1736550 RepID=UPI0006F895E9|nr:CE1759 family FMN reductase [Aeromicrobium sp. Root495]KQY55271.1 NADPH-dependent FMN reductase [Aeromicrobium sp. Root495]